MIINADNGSKPDRYNIKKSAIDVFKALAKESNNYKDFDSYIESLDSAAAKEFSNDGSPSYWIENIMGSRSTIPIDWPSSMLWSYYYVIASKRTRVISAEVNDVRSKINDFDSKFKDIESKLDKLLQSQSDLTASITKLESDLTSKIDSDTTQIEKHATAEASRVISQFP